MPASASSDRRIQNYFSKPVQRERKVAVPTDARAPNRVPNTVRHSWSRLPPGCRGPGAGGGVTVCIPVNAVVTIQNADNC